ncbi:MAG TPA: pyridoxal phosphate-dependent aminotransferase [Bacteroidota bacterium]|nr:pyridoxal phosphate-dependent aminotransferase [Bacteroidota bacterium]
MFSTRTNWHRKPNRLTEAIEQHRKSGKELFDLASSNPTECGIPYPEKEILAAFSNQKTLHYQPDPHGLLSAREAVCEYYHAKNVDIDPPRIFLTASTSEAYANVFKLLCDAGDEVLVPRPSYPLFEYLAQLNDVELGSYHLRYDGEWHIDLDSVSKAIGKKTRAIALISPHNPTGMFLKKNEYEAIERIAEENNLALIVDEVFSEYGFENQPRHPELVSGSINSEMPKPSTQTAGKQSAAGGRHDGLFSVSGRANVLTFTLNGISKMLGLPQMKLGWIAVSGPEKAVSEAVSRLEIICDTYLSVNTPVQVALPPLMKSGAKTRERILDRVRNNYRTLRQTFSEGSACSVLHAEGGWNGIIRVPRTMSDEDRCLKLLNDSGVIIHPGYYYDFDEEGYLVVSLLGEEKIFGEGVKRVAKNI